MESMESASHETNEHNDNNNERLDTPENGIVRMSNTTPFSNREEYSRLMFDIRNMKELGDTHRIALRKLSKNQLLQIIEIYNIVVKNINYVFSWALYSAIKLNHILIYNINCIYTKSYIYNRYIRYNDYLIEYALAKYHALFYIFAFAFYFLYFIKMSVSPKNNRPNSIYIPTPLKMETATTLTKTSPCGSPSEVASLSPTSMVSMGTNTDNEEFTNTSVYVCDLEVFECVGNFGGTYKCYKVFGYYFPFECPIHMAFQTYLKSLKYDEKIRHMVCRVGLDSTCEMDIKTNGKRLFVVPLYRRVDLKMPNMLVYRNCIFDIHVPLDIIFYPKGELIDGKYSYVGPVDTLSTRDDDLSDTEFCWNCDAYGIYNGVFISLCTTCSQHYNNRFSYLVGYGNCGIGFYNIPPERRLDALPEYFPGNISLDDIGYTTLKTTSCSSVEFSVDETPDEPPYLYLESIVDVNEEYDESADSHHEEFNGMEEDRESEYASCSEDDFMYIDEDNEDQDQYQDPYEDPDEYY